MREMRIALGPSRQASCAPHTAGGLERHSQIYPEGLGGTREATSCPGSSPPCVWPQFLQHMAGLAPWRSLAFVGYSHPPRGVLRLTDGTTDTTCTWARCQYSEFAEGPCSSLWVHGSHIILPSAPHPLLTSDTTCCPLLLCGPAVMEWHSSLSLLSSSPSVGHADSAGASVHTLC